MRDDMDKVLVERPRYGGGIRYPRGSEKGFRRVDMEHVPRREGMKRPWLRTSSPKHLNENLAPLRRYLRSNVGRPWDKVFSEMSQHMRLDSAVQLHIWQHVQWYICFNATRIGRDYVDTCGVSVRKEFLVDARSGLLRKNPQHGHWRRYIRSIGLPPPPPSPFEKVIEIDELHHYGQIDGIWYLVTLAPMPPPKQRVNLWDVVHHKRVGELDGRKFYCVAKRQLNSKEIRRLRGTS